MILPVRSIDLVDEYMSNKSIICKSQEKSFIMTILRNTMDVCKPYRHVPCQVGVAYACS